MAAPQPTRSATLSIDLPQSRNWEPCGFRFNGDGGERPVSAGNLEDLVSRVITDIEDPSRNDRFRATFLTTYQLFATNERLFDILKRRFESSELDPVAAGSRYPWVNNALPSNEY
jgi:RasGEF N-terminal motif